MSCSVVVVVVIVVVVAVVVVVVVVVVVGCCCWLLLLLARDLKKQYSLSLSFVILVVQVGDSENLTDGKNGVKTGEGGGQPHS